jgi:hypothetical protein
MGSAGKQTQYQRQEQAETTKHEYQLGRIVAGHYFTPQPMAKGWPPPACLILAALNFPVS